MDNTLKSLFVRLNVNLQNLTSKAIAQLIIKIVFNTSNPLSAKDIKDALAQLNEYKHINDKEVDDILNDLVPNELKHANGRYYLSQPRRREIQRSIDKSNERKEAILQKYFSELNSDRILIVDWLQEVTIKFFESFSDEWISDIVASTSHVNHSEDSIRTLVANRTNSLKSLDPDDRKVLPAKFFSFVTDNDPMVEEYLWEYGTSAFASKLIRVMHGVDGLTLETFRNSYCILDTNILMFIALESRYKGAFEAIEKVFMDLGVKVKILYITQQEYDNKIAYQKNVTLQNLEKYGADLTMLPDDDFTNYAKSLHCVSEEDFVRCFDVSLARPQYVHEKLAIELLDDDKDLLAYIEKMQQDKAKKNDLNNIYKAFAKHDKFKPALSHDIGLIEGVNYLRNQDIEDNKYYILSEEISINQYSKAAGFKKNLPLSLRVNTLINLLAINNGGDTFDASTYAPLFANIIRAGLIPHDATFRQTELYRYYQMNARITSLSPERIKDIVMEMHNRMIKGAEEIELYRDLEEMITKGELGMNKELEATKEDLELTNRRANREKESKEAAIDLLREEFTKKNTDAYDADTERIRKRWKFYIPLVVLGSCVILSLVAYFVDEQTWQFSSCISFGTSVLATLICNQFVLVRKVEDRNRNKGAFILQQVENELHNKLLLKKI